MAAELNHLDDIDALTLAANQVQNALTVQFIRVYVKKPISLQKIMLFIGSKFRGLTHLEI